MIDSSHLSYALTERFGLAVTAESEKVSEGYRITLWPANIAQTISFRIELNLGWRTISAVFEPGNFAASLVNSMNAAAPEQRAAFSVFADSLKSKGAQIIIKIGDNLMNSTDPNSWPSTWSNIKIHMKKIGIILENRSGYDFNVAFPWATGFFGMVLSLLPVEEIPDTPAFLETEGTPYYSLVRKYERSRINRAACIEVNGDLCNICGFSFSDTYGNFGEGFITVHHIVPISEIGEGYVLNPSKDLIPVCPNCHAMLHHKQPVLQPWELISILKKHG